MTVTKTITTSKPFYVVAGAGDLAVKTIKDGTEKLGALRSIDLKDVESTLSTLQTTVTREAKALPAKTQTVAVSLAADVAGKVGSGYDELLDRGRSIVTRVRRQQSTKDASASATTTVRQAKAATTTAKKSAAGTKKATKSAATSARKTAKKSATAASAAAGKLGR